MDLDTKFAKNIKLDEIPSIIKEAVKSHGNKEKPSFSANIEILMAFCTSKEDNEAITALKIVKELMHEAPNAQAFTKECLGACLEQAANKSAEVRKACVEGALSICEKVNPFAIKSLLPVILSALTADNKWEIRELALKCIIQFWTTAPRQLSNSLVEVTPEVTACMWDTNERVKTAATIAMKAAFDAVGNKDIEDLTAQILVAITNPEEVSDIIQKMAGLTFVQSVKSGMLAMVMPLLLHGLREKNEATKQQSAAIINDLSKLVENPIDAASFLPVVLPALKNNATNSTDHETREVTKRAMTQLNHLKALSDKQMSVFGDGSKLEEELKKVFDLETVEADLLMVIQYACTIATTMMDLKVMDKVQWTKNVANQFVGICGKEKADACTEKIREEASKLFDKALQVVHVPVPQLSMEGAITKSSFIVQDEESLSVGSGSYNAIASTNKQNQNLENDTVNTTSSAKSNHQRAKSNFKAQIGKITSIIMRPFYVILMVIWPILSVTLGIILGSMMSFVITSTVFLLTFLRTPMHIGKMLFVTATTKECFQGHLASILRLAVFLCVPAVHVLFLIGITAFSATIGTLYYIGKATQIVYNHEYTKTAKKIKSNVRLEPKSYLGKYIKKCKEYMANDSKSYGTIYFLKGTIAMIPGVAMATLVFLPFSLAMVAITAYRLPINLFKTVKISLFTVILKWDLRLFVLVMLPIIHSLFPLVVLFTALFGSFFWTWYQVSTNVFEGDNPVKDVHELNKVLSRYYKAHEDFVEEHCQVFDHPSGIPDGWDGTVYEIEIEKILRFQRDFVICCFLILLEIPVFLFGVAVISAVKYIPCCMKAWKDYCTDQCVNISCVAVLGMWPFHVLAILLVPVFVLIVMIILVMINLVVFFFEVPNEYFYCNDTFEKKIRNAFMVQFDAIATYDERSGEYIDWTIFRKCDRHCRGSTGNNDWTSEQRGRDEHFRDPAELYWDRFSSQCVSTKSELLQKGWISAQDVEELEPAIIQSIPAVAILTIIVDSIQDKTLKDGDIKWSIDGCVCKEVDRKLDDAITECLWPMVRSIQRLLLLKEKKVLLEDNIELLRAMLCANSEKENEDVKRVLQGDGEEMHVINNQIRTKINSLVLAILRVKPYQQRMDSIFSENILSLGDDDKA